MPFTDAVRSVLNQYVGFTGRARRSEYWYWILFYIVLSIIASMLDRAVFHTNYGSWFSAIVGLGLLLAPLGRQRATAARHEPQRLGGSSSPSSRSIGGIILIVFYAQDSHGDKH